MATMKVALVQKKAVPNNKNSNLELAAQYIQEASSLGADLVLFPEMWSNGYAPPFDGAFDNPTDPAFEKERRAWLDSAVTINSDYVGRDTRRCRKIQGRRLRHFFCQRRKTNFKTPRSSLTAAEISSSIMQKSIPVIFL